MMTVDVSVDQLYAAIIVSTSNPTSATLTSAAIMNSSSRTMPHSVKLLGENRLLWGGTLFHTMGCCALYLRM